MRPFIEEARYAAEHRNHYWRVLRGVTGSATDTVPYPSKGQKFNDEPAHDRGKNFGRVARGGLMEPFIIGLLEQPVSGIPIKHWQALLKIFAEGVGPEAIDTKLKKMRKEAEEAKLTSEGLEAFDRIQDGLRELISKL